MDAQTAARYAQIRQQFLAGLPRRLADIEAAPDDDARSAALHRLAGAAGSFDCEALGGFARAALQALRAGDRAQFAAQLTHLRSEIAHLRGT